MSEQMKSLTSKYQNEEKQRLALEKKLRQEELDFQRKEQATEQKL